MVQCVSVCLSVWMSVENIKNDLRLYVRVMRCDYYYCVYQTEVDCRAIIDMVESVNFCMFQFQM